MMLNRYLVTLYYLKVSQVFYRLFHKLRIYKNPKCTDEYKTHKILNALRKSQVTNFLYGPSSYTFLNVSLDVGSDWFPPSTNRLWVYNLHYFDYLFECTSSDEKVSRICNWIESVSFKAKDAWHPYTISLRLCNWIWSLSEEAGPVDSRICKSIYQQLHFLSYHLEFDVLGNHLIENCKALIIGGLFLNEEEFLSKGLKILEHELVEQILDDGGHYERTPMYHIIVLADLIAIYDGLMQADREAVWLLHVIKKMSIWLYQVSDGDFFPLFNDSSFDITYSPQIILNYVKDTYGFTFDSSVSGLLKESGVFYYKSNGIKLWLDCGDLGPDFLLAHAHNDSLNIELHMNDDVILTDSGTYDYESGQALQWRPYFRSSKAHNVITLNNDEPNDIWGSFRVAHRGYTSVLDYNEYSCFASHNSYKNRGAIIYRFVQVDSKHLSVRIEDSIETFNNKEQTFESYFHFSPHITLVSISLDCSGHVVIVQAPSQKIKFYISSLDVTLGPIKTWYSDKFMVKEERLSLKISGKTTCLKKLVTDVCVYEEE